LPHLDAQPSGGQACGAIAEQLIQTAGKFLSRLQSAIPAFTSGQPPNTDTVRQSL